MAEYRIDDINEEHEEDNAIGNDGGRAHDDIPGRKPKGRKRKHPNQTRSICKIRRNSNEDFINNKGDQVFSKEFRDYHCNCKCNERVSVDTRLNIFNKYWSLGEYNSQSLFICSQVSEKEVGRKRAKDSNKRKYTREYRLDNEVVCKSLFMQTLRVSSNRINTALNRIKSNDLRDRRGVPRGGYNQLDPDKVEKVKQHISSFPRYKSHYCRSSTESMFLPSDLTLSKMYDLYKNMPGNENPVSKASYSKIFYSSFNLRRKPLKKDTCNTCDSYKAKLDSTNTLGDKEQISTAHEQHLVTVEKVRKLMKEDFKNAKESEKKETLTFDLEKTLPLPKIPTNIVYYKRQIMLYNCGVHSAKTNRGYFYVWVEGTAGRGAQDVGSCVKKHILTKCDNVEELVLWADSCGGQNRNIKMTLMLKHIMEHHLTLKKITIRFPISGHSFLPNDSEFGDVECHLRTHERLYTDTDYINVMKTCRKKNPFEVTKMAKEDFFGTKLLEKSIVNRKKDLSGHKVNWFNIREIEIRRDEPFKIFVKTNLEEEFHKVIDLTKTVQRKVTDLSRLLANQLPLLWPEGKPISQAKLVDIKSLMYLIPASSKPFYREFTSNPNITDDIDGFSGEVDFDIEENGVAAADED